MIGVGDAVRAHAVSQEMGIRYPDGRWLLRSRTERMVISRFGDPVILLPRALVIEALLSRVPGQALALSTNLGQGACQALEDVVVLSRLAAGAGADDMPAVLASFTATRLPRTTDVVRWSHRAARITTWTARSAVATRNTAVRLLGKVAPAAALRGLGPIYDWQPPAPGR